MKIDTIASLAGRALRFALAVVLLAGLTACASTQSAETQLDDAGLEAAVKAKITADPDTNPFEINVDVQEGVAYLTGTVDDQGDRAEAEKLARSVDGIRKVVNEINYGDQTVGGMVDDASISARVKAKITADPELNPFNIEVTTEQGVIHLTGRVPTADDKREAAELARSVSGVKNVVNRLEVGSVG